VLLGRRVFAETQGHQIQHGQIYCRQLARQSEDRQADALPALRMPGDRYAHERCMIVTTPRNPGETPFSQWPPAEPLSPRCQAYARSRSASTA
jgi:hypothetical protein